MKINGHEWYEVTKDFSVKAEAEKALRHYRTKDAGHSFTRLVKKGNVWVVVQREKYPGIHQAAH